MSTAPPPGVRRLASHGIAYVAGTALQGVGILLVTPFITRTLSRDGYGQVSAALVAIQLVGTVVAAGLPQVILREHHRRDDGGRGARALAGVMFLGAGTLCVLAGGFAAVGGLAGAETGSAPLVVVGAGALTGVVAGQSLMRAQARPGRFLAISFLATVVAQSGGLLAARQAPTPSAFLLAYDVLLLAAAVLAALLTRPIWPGREAEAVRQGLRLAAPLLPHAVAMLVLLMGDVLVVLVVLGSASVAEYQVALLFGNMPFVLTTALVNAWAPAVFARPAAERWAWTARTGAALALVVAAGAATLALPAPWLAAIAAPASFDRPVIVVLVAIMVAVGPAYLLYNGSSLALIDGAATGRLAWAAVAAATTLVLLAGLGASVAGVRGVAVARLAGYLVLSVVTAVMARRHGLHWGARPVLAVTVLTALVALGAGALLPVSGAGATVRLAVLAGLAAAAGTAVVVAARRHGDGLWNAVRRRNSPT
ncbi:MAG TPA: polysaccharide biosynthesis protein [Dermatophilaceae bacterium]|nr:polysaccharide biosynthesis protein [Dermatophilaceae bacterium]